MIMKISANVKNCDAVSEMPKKLKNNFGNIFKIFFENQHLFCVLKNFGGLIQGGVMIKFPMRVCREKMFYEKSPKIYSF